MIIPISQKGFFNSIMIWLFPILEAVIVIMVVYSVMKGIIHYKRNTTKKDFLKVTRMSLESKLGNGFLLEAILTELSVFYYSLFVWHKKPNIENGKVYFYHKTSQIKTIVIVFSILIILEGIGLHFVFQIWSDIAAWIFTILNIYALLYMIGLYNSTRFLPHMIYSDKILICLGYQSRIELDIKNIQSIQPAKKQGGIGETIPKDTYYAMLYLDTPQYEIFLKEPALMKSTYGRKNLVNTVIFRADQPSEIIDDINKLILNQ